MKIHGIMHVIDTDPDTFYKNLASAVNTLQADGQEVEVQYSTNVINMVNDAQMVTSALVLGRK